MIWILGKTCAFNGKTKSIKNNIKVARCEILETYLH
jgi:hypothetical protein